MAKKFKSEICTIQLLIKVDIHIVISAAVQIVGVHEKERDFCFDQL